MAIKQEVQENRREAQELALLKKLKEWFQEDIINVQAWRKEAKEDFGFYNGNQWSEEDLAALKRKKRPVMTFNRIAPLVNAILGSERNNKREVRYIPREKGDAVANELLTAAGEWFRQQADAEYEDSEAFSDAVICGMGWTETRLAFDNNPDGDPYVSRLDPFKMVWDANAVKANLTDAQRLWYIDEKPLYVAQEMFPDVSVSDLDARWVFMGSGENDLKDNNTHYTSEEEAPVKKTVTLVEARWFEREAYYKVIDPFTGACCEYKEKDYQILQEQYPQIRGVRFMRKIVRRAFLGKKLLAPVDSPLVPAGQLGWECITAYRDPIKRQFYGVVRTTKDPQRWANKFFSQVMFLLNSQAKGGILAERGAFEDIQQAEESFSRTDQITWMKNGGIAKIQPKPTAQFPSGFFTLFREAKETIMQVTGISLEFIGTRSVIQAGVLEEKRKQASLSILAQLFDSLSRYRKRQGMLMLYLIQNHLSDGRLISIFGEDKKEYVALTRERIANQQYDIIVDEGPLSANEKERSFEMIQQLLPLLKEYLTPEIGFEILKYSPLPPSLIDKWTEMTRKQQEQAQQAVLQEQNSPELLS